jgi:hypothetical protein
MEFETAKEAYWISPDGKVTPVENKHISAILADPEYFGFGADEVRDAFDKYHEKYGWEGKAREEIMKSLFAKGWVRVRRKKDFSFTIQTNDITESIKRILSEFSKKMSADKINAGYSVTVKTESGEEQTTFYDLTVCTTGLQPV